MAKKSAIAINLEYLALRSFCALVNAIPYRLALWIARAFAVVAVKWFGFKKERTLHRIKSVFPDICEAKASEIAVDSLSNILQSGVEMIRAPKLDRRWMDRYVLDGAYYKDKLQSYVDEGRGVVIMVPHAGNWYMAAWSMAKYGLKLFALAAKQRNPKLDAWMKRQYGDIEVLDRGEKSTLVKIKEKLESGRAFAILPDLRVPVKDVEVDFLGSRANVSHAGAMFAVKCMSPVVVAMMTRKNGRHIFNHLATLRPDPAAVDKKEEARRITREAMTVLSKAVMESPGDWFWYNKRWILEPVHKG
jgi:KDO2-lipid IV(A) lauroyltransferase